MDSTSKKQKYSKQERKEFAARKLAGDVAAPKKASPVVDKKQMMKNKKKDGFQIDNSAYVERFKGSAATP